jgi:hypothetical protein
MGPWQTFHRRPAWLRWPIKTLLFAAVVLLTLFPKLWLVPTWLARLRNMNALVQPEHPGLAPLEEVARARAAQRDPADLLAVVQELVYERIPYAWDWDTWGVMDYLPTTAEVLEKGREDCDGRAVLAAALLRRMGQPAWLLCDLKHVWIGTPAGETMSPGAGERTIESGPEGTRVQVTPGAVANVGRGLAYGIAVFPLGRELIIAAALGALAAQPRSSRARRAAGWALLAIGLLLMRRAGATPAGLALQPGLLWAGLACVAAGWLTLVIKGADRDWPLPAPAPRAGGDAGRG